MSPAANFFFNVIEFLRLSFAYLYVISWEIFSSGSQSCSSVFCQPRVQLMIIMVSLGTMLCLSMICGCLVSRNHYLFRLKSSNSTDTSPNLTICSPNSNFPSPHSVRRSSDSSQPSNGNQQVSSPLEEMSLSATFLQQEQDHNYIQFYNPPQPTQTPLQPTQIHDTYQSLPRPRHLHYVLPSPRVANQRGLLYPKPEDNKPAHAVLVPVKSNYHVHHRDRASNGRASGGVAETEWIWDSPSPGSV